MRARAAAVVVGLLLTSCTSDADTPQGSPTPDPPRQTGGEVVFGVLGEPPTLDPYDRSATDLTWAAVRPLYPSLYRFLPDGNIEPYLAASIQPEGDGALVVLNDMKWSDGQPITADDVVASVERARPPSGFARVSRAHAVDEATVALRGDVSNWERALATVAFVMPRGRPQGQSGRFGGPLVVARHRPGLEILYRRNPQWDGPGYIDGLRLQFVANLGFLMQLVEDKRLDAALLPSSVNIDERLEENDIAFQSALGWERIYLDFNGSGLGRAQRAALVDEIDREMIAEAFVRDDGRIADTVYPAPGSGPIATGPFEGDAGRVNEPDGNVLFTAPAGDELLAYILRVMQRQIDAADLELAAAEVAAVYGGGEDDPGGVHIRRAAGIPGAADAPGAARSLETWPLFHVKTFIAVAPSLHGVEVNPTVEGPLWNVEAWWLGR